MSQFPDTLIAEQLYDDVWLIHEPYRFIHTKKDGTEETITVPKHYKTNFASVPSLFWSFISNRGIYDGPAVIHDYLYGIGGRDTTPARSRKEADDIFMDGMKTVKVPTWKRLIMWRFVRMFASKHWDKID